LVGTRWDQEIPLSASQRPKLPPPHIHETEDEFFHVVKGEFKVKLGDHIMSAPARSVMFVPRIIPKDLPNNASVKFSHLILLDTKFPRQIFNFAKCVFPFSNCDAVFTSRFFRKYHELPH
jgi:mannose-6-phosphate isomerase-like protein (cupin superfamily)